MNIFKNSVGHCTRAYISVAKPTYQIVPLYLNVHMLLYNTNSTVRLEQINLIYCYTFVYSQVLNKNLLEF